MVDLPQPDGAEKMKQCPSLVFTSVLTYCSKKIDTATFFGQNGRVNSTQYFVLARAFGLHKL